MISAKFVKIAREVIDHIRKGNKLSRGSLVSNNSTTCPLGAVCLNNGIDITPNIRPHVLYNFAETKTELTFDFTVGFDDSGMLYGNVNGNNYTENVDYEIGFALGRMCDKRKWIDTRISL